MSIRRIVVMGMAVAFLVVAVFIYIKKSESSFEDTLDRSVYQWQGMVYKNVDEYLYLFQIDSEIVDKESFTLLSDGLAYDKNNIYYLRSIVPNDSEDHIQKYRKLQIKDLKNRFTGPDIDKWDIDTFQVLSLHAGVFRDKNNVYYAGYRKNISTEKVQVIGDIIYTDGRRTYAGINTILLLDPAKLEFVNGFVTDGSQTYQKETIFSYKKVTGVNPKEIIILNNSFRKDNHNYFFYNKKIEGIDYHTFKYFEFHAADKNQGYFFREYFDTVMMSDIDYETFEELGRFESRDKNHFYYNGVMNPEVDASSVEVNQYGSFYDNNHAIIEGKVIKEVDPLSYRYNTATKYGADDQFIYFNHMKILDSDPESLSVLKKVLGGSYAKDKKHVYFKESVIEGANPEEFQYVGEDFFKDKKHIYYKGEPIEGVDAESFEVINSHLFRDMKSVIFLRAGYVTVSNTVKDPETFRFSGDRVFYQDQDNVYLIHNVDNDFVKLEGIKTDQFELLTRGYFKDGNKIYYSFFDESKFLEVDTEYTSFKVIDENETVDSIINALSLTGGVDAKDKNHCFLKGEKVSCP